MEFWGVEVKAGKPLKVTPDEGKLIHMSQAALGEGKKEKGSEIIPLRVNINDKNYIVGSLSAENFPQITFDLVFEKEFELSHDWKNGSVYFCGYMADNDYGEEDSDDFYSEDDERLPSGITENGKVESKVEEVKPDAGKGKAAKPDPSAKPKVAVPEPKKDESDDEDDDDDDDNDDEEESEDDEEMKDASSDDLSGDSDDEDDSVSDSSEEDEETPKKAVDKKRPNESATKTPVPAKKSKIDSAQKTDGKKGGGHEATPHPLKQGGKTPASNKPQPPKSGGSISCKSCSKTFTSENALQSHTKAKHAAK